ncbi:MAG: Rieske (2Fe-2S) protein [Candidatus Neomarinimicrobiota bacterium]
MAYPIVRYLIPPPIPEANISSIRVGSVGDFSPETGIIFQFGRIPGILIRLENGQFKAFSATCTHLSCIVQYRGDLNQIWCACHNGRFDLTGRNVAGPPPRPLEEYDVKLEGEEVWVTKRA